MKRSKIFVAGSKSLQAERNALKALAHEMNNRYRKKKIDVLVEISSYEDLGDNQNVYDKFITETADVVIFVFDGKMNEITEKEFNTAADAFKQKKLPEILVFIKKCEKETDEIKRIHKLTRDRLGSYYCSGYENEADLKKEAKLKIEDLVNPIAHNRNAKKWRIATIAVAVLSLFILAGLTSYFVGSKKNHEPRRTVVLDDEPLLLFMGGGSVAKFIEDSDSGWGIKLDSLDSDSYGNFHNTIYMGVATGHLWNMLGEEYYKNEEVYNQKFYPIFLAADTISVKQIKSTIPKKEEISNNILIFKTYIGDDPINTYIGSMLSQKMKENEDYYIDSNGNKYQDSQQLIRLLEQQVQNTNQNDLYTTSPESGTLGKYRTVIGEALINRILECGHVYNEHRPIASGNNFVILGSQFYYPNPLPNHEKFFVKSNNSPTYLYKKLYLYFVAYWPGQTTNKEKQFIIPKPVQRFFNILNKKGKLTYTDDTPFSWDEHGYVNVKKEYINSDGIVDLVLKKTDHNTIH